MVAKKTGNKEQKYGVGTAAQRTQSLERLDVSTNELIPTQTNPNEMDEASFNMLYDNVERVGMTDPILVRRTPEGKYRIVGGHHRWEVAKLVGLEMVPCTVITDPDFDDDMEAFQVVRHNVIKGKMNPAKFMKLYESLSGKYAEDVAAEMFGFTDEEEFRKLVKATAKSLPPEMKHEFEAAAKEIKTVDDLAVLLNQMFSNYGDTLPYGFMVFDFGGKDHVWVRMMKGSKKQFLGLGDYCKEQGRTADGIILGLVQLIAQKNEAVLEALAPIIASLPEVDLANAPELPTLEEMASHSYDEVL